MVLWAQGGTSLNEENITRPHYLPLSPWQLTICLAAGATIALNNLCSQPFSQNRAAYLRGIAPVSYNMGCDPFDRNPVSRGMAQPTTRRQRGMVSEEGSLCQFSP